MNAQVSLVKCSSYDPALVQEAVRRAVDLLGGMENFIQPGSWVLVKPNILMAKDPGSGIDTHPEVVRAVIKLLKEVKSTIFVGDGPSVWGSEIENVAEVYRRSGIEKVCFEEKVNLVEFDRRRWRGKFPMTSWLDKCRYVINLPKFKTHSLTLLTGAVKNLFGLVSGTYKTEIHKNYFEVEKFANILLDVYEEARPQLTIVDGIVAMEGDGPATSGKLRDLNIVLGGSDCVAVDTVMASIMGVKPLDVVTIKEAARRGLGISDLSFIDILGESIESVGTKPFLLPAASLQHKIPLPLINLAKKLITYYPFVLHRCCTHCTACVKACPTQAVALKNDRITINYRKCISCFCCLETCPSSAIKVKKSLLAKLLGL